jgi:hypothetical protein
MPKLKRIVVTHTTANEAKAGSNAQFTLVIQKPPPAQDFTMKFPDHPGKNEREPGKMDVYEFDVERQNINTDDAGFDILMSVNTGNPGDEWLPAAIVVLGQTSDDEIIHLGDHNQWTGEWFDKKIGRPTHQISFT